MRPATILFFALLTCLTAAVAGPTEDALRVGEEAFEKKDFSSATTTWANAYNERAKADTADDETCAKILSRLGSLLAQLGRPKDSVVCYESLLQLRTKLSGPADPETQNVKALLAAQITNSGGDVARAEGLARSAVEALTKAGDDRLDDRLRAMITLAGILLSKKERLQAHELYADVARLCEKQPTQVLHLAIEAYTSMASIAEFFGRAKDTLQYLRKAAEVCRKHYGAEHPATYMARIEVASALSGTGKSADAKTVYDGVLADLDARSPGKDEKLLHQRWALAAFRLAYVESSLGNKARVFELVSSALSHAQLGWGDTDANTLPIYLELARLHITRKNYKEGVKCYQKVLDIRRRELGPDDDSTKQTQKILNELLEDVRKAEAAK